MFRNKIIYLLFSAVILTGTSVAVEAREPNAMQTAPSSFATLAEKLSPTVVNVSSSQSFDDEDEEGGEFDELPQFQFPEGSPFQDFFEDFMNRRDQFGGRGGPALPAASLGSGFIIDAENGYIVTNNHVVRDADEVRITLHDDSTIPAEIVGRDEKIDIAVLKVDTDKKLEAIDFGNSEDMRVGDWVVAIGNPFGLGGTVTAGIVSARQRDINSGPYDDYIQTDASINRGNSGGPMFNLEGEVIGINTAIYSPSGGSVGIGFAIPSNLAKPVIDQLIKYGRTKRGWLGVRIQTVTEDIADSLGLDEARGALVASVTEDGPAEKAKLEPGDIILEFDGKDVNTMRALPRIVAETDIDKQVVVKYWRDGKERKAKVSIGELEKAEEDGLLAENSEGMDDDEPKKSKKVEKLGLSLAPLSNANRDMYGIDDDVDGMIVTKVERRSNAAEEGILIGDVIEEMNQKPIKSIKDVNGVVKTATLKGKSSVLLLLNREGDVRFTALKLEEDNKKKKDKESEDKEESEE
ncbi:MAG: DegQ family serine endoprotease [Pseudomonadota bacterium]